VANLVVSAVSTFDNKGLKKASKEISAFDKGIKSLGKTFAGVFAATAILNYSKKAVDAFSKDQAAAKALETQLKNTGYAFSAPDVEYYIASLQKATGVLDDHLRPAFQSLLTASGSLTQSQKALAIALDVSAATGRSVEEVSTAIAKGFSGQTTALGRLGAGLSKATLASGDMNKILDELGGKFSGQAQARLTTYAGKMDILKVSAANASETIGKGLLDSLSMLGKDQNIAVLGSALEKLATTIANVVVGLGAILGKVVSIGEAIFSKLHLDKVIGFLYNNSLIGLLSKFGASQTDKQSSNFTYGLGANAGVELAKIQELKARKSLVTQLKAEADLKKLQDKYNIERISLMAALNFATDAETKTRLAEKLAILDGNAAKADEYLAARNADQALVKLATSTDDAKKALDKLKDWDPLSGLKPTPKDLAYLNSTTTGGGGGASSNQTPIYPPATTPYDPLSSLTVSPADIASIASYNPLSGMAPTRQDIYNVYNNIEGSILSQQELDVIFQNSLLQLKRNGASLNYAGA